VYLLTVGGIFQPKAVDSYGKIWLAIDLDSDLSNGIQEQAEVIDPALQTFQPTLLTSVSLSASKFLTRQNKLFIKANLTVPLRTVSQDKVLFLQLNEAFTIARNGISNIECRLYRTNDESNFVYLSNLTPISQELHFQMLICL
jgi:hypothetical protein